jgi:hypothetical protein
MTFPLQADDFQEWMKGEWSCYSSARSWKGKPLTLSVSVGSTLVRVQHGDNGGECLYQGNDHDHALKVFNEYVKHN